MQKKIDQLFKRFCKKLEVKLVFTSEKLRCVFSTKDPYKSEHLSKVVYKFLFASCNASYVDQIWQHLAIRIDENFGKDKKFTNINTLCHPEIVQINVLKIVFLF